MVWEKDRETSNRWGYRLYPKKQTSKRQKDETWMLDARVQPQPVIAGTFVTRSKQQFLVLLCTGIVVPHLTRSSNVVSLQQNNVSKSSYQAHIHSRGVRDRKAEMRSFVLVVTTSSRSSSYAAIEPKTITYARCPGAFAWKTRIGTVKYWGHYDDISEKEVLLFAQICDAELLPIRKPVDTERIDVRYKNGKFVRL